MCLWMQLIFCYRLQKHLNCKGNFWKFYSRCLFVPNKCLIIYYNVIWKKYQTYVMRNHHLRKHHLRLITANMFKYHTGLHLVCMWAWKNHSKLLNWHQPDHNQTPILFSTITPESNNTQLRTLPSDSNIRCSQVLESSDQTLRSWF